MPDTLPVHDRTETPEPPTMLIGFSVQGRLVEFVVTERFTVPAKPLRGVTVIAEVLRAVAFVVTIVGLTVRMKS